MRITIISPYYPPEIGAPPARLYEIAVRLQKFGHSVTVVTAFPNRPTGKIYDGYKGKFLDCSMEDGVRVIRSWIKPSPASASFLGRTVNDLSFTWSSGWTTAKLLGPQDVLIAQNPPIFSGLNAGHLARKIGARLVMWCGDIWPDILLQSGQLKPGIMATCMHRLQQYNFNRSKLLAVTNPAIADDVSKSYRCPPIVVWSNGVDTKLFRPDLREQQVRDKLGAMDQDLLVGYIGLHGRFQGLDVIIEAANILRSHKNIKFVFIGEGVDKAKLVQRSQSLKLDNLKFLPIHPKKDIPGILASCDISVVSLLWRMPGTMPSKFYEALAAGTIPLVADGCEAASLVKKHNVGVVYEPDDEHSAALAIKKVGNMTIPERQNMRNNARELAMRFDRDRLACFINITLESLISGRELPKVEW